MAETNITANAGMEFTYIHVPYLIICIFGAVSNVLLLVVFIKDPLKCFRNSGTYLVISLSVSDLLTNVFGSFTHIKPRTGFYLFLLTYWFGSVSLASLSSVSIDRFIIVTYPIQYRILVKGKAMVLWLATIWIVTCAIPLCMLFSDSHEASTKSALHIFNATVAIISAVIYASTYHKLKKLSRNIALTNSNESRAQTIRILKERRFLNTIIILACIAFVCTVPPLIISAIYIFQDLERSKIYDRIIVSILQINFAVNPLIYIIRLPNYRKTFYLIYCRKRTSSS